MIRKYPFIAFAIISISILSCHQDEDLLVTELKSIKLQSKDIVAKKTLKKSDSCSYSKSSDSTDTPKNTTHWKISDSTITDTPKNTTHWRKKY